MRRMQFNFRGSLFKLIAWIVAFFVALNLSFLYLPVGFVHEPDLELRQWYNHYDPKFGFYFSYREELVPLASTHEALAIFTNEGAEAGEVDRIRISLRTVERSLVTSESDCIEHFLPEDISNPLEPDNLSIRGRDLLIGGSPSYRVVCHGFEDRWLAVIWEGAQPPFFASSIASVQREEPQRVVVDNRPPLSVTWQLAGLSLTEQQALYYHIPHPNLQALYTAPEITGHSGADERIRALATQRGYQLQFTPIEPVTDEPERIQPAAYPDWQALRAAAAAEGITLGLTSTYRSVSEQRQLFLGRLNQFFDGSSYGALASGAHDAAIQRTLDLVSPPGYSRHHTGYALDIEDLTASERGKPFKDTAAFAWLSANDYKNALSFGFIASFPEGVAAGPEPEEWEYLWVGGQD